MVAYFIHYNEAMAYLRKINYRRKRLIPEHLLPILFQGVPTVGLERAAATVRKHANLKDYQYDYWAIYESKRINGEPKSICLYLFGETKKKPSVISIEKEILQYRDFARTDPNKFADKYISLTYAVSRLSGRKWKRLSRKYPSIGVPARILSRVV